MITLAIDTSTAYASVSLFIDQKVFTQTSYLPRQHNQYLLPMIDEILTKAGVKKHKVELLAYGVGPGSFVGVRLAASIMHAMSLPLSVPVIGFSSMKASAINHFYKTGQRRIAIVLDARMGDVYLGLYEISASEDIRTIAEYSDTPSQLVAALHAFAPAVLIGDQVEDFILPDETEYCPDTQYLFPLIKQEYQAHDQSMDRDALPVYLQGTKHWRKL
ncbi:tRNA (adenosine(37)-N6)-threonylcarbamoyltransferase complex dimerization subunit type 1 TsaB [Facilibium subflavum]|uniref:tRNA (adenosine(37)-N6)-threonylcarbamoyltransferase complex dimerization subunit type 1 TsaB n=1 Tax=Facilibium subflavum TaxID=2219058 RepID=UPI000E646005|nr:tRNA (adenosine(37)-N6)-threonylcarbamoyltransferase complex dimerization subunit type 1 TsaB [Facilibium subflavum]